MASNRACKTTACPNFSEEGSLYCSVHSKRQKADSDARQRKDNEISRKIYNSKEWKVLRQEMIYLKPACPCGQGAEVVHHLIPIEQAPDRAYDKDNLLPLCKNCHDRLTMIDRSKRRY